MKEFITAVTETVAEDERAAKIKARTAELMEANEGMTAAKAKKQATAEIDAEAEEPFIEFKVDGRVLRAFNPTDGQLTFMLASLGRGQTQDQRFASIINIMLETLRDEDRDYMESRLLSRENRLPVKTVEEIFEHLTEQWFGGKVTPPA